MKTSTIAAALVVALFCGAHSTDAQVQIIRTETGGDMGPLQLPPPGRELKTGTGRIRGRLLSGETGTPVRRAEVRISSTEIMPKTAVTDADGRYEFRDLPAGRFTLSASKAGYVTINYGQTRPFESGKAIELADGQALDNTNFTMPRGSAIAGRIIDEFGDPIADAQVSAMRSVWSNGKRRLQPTGRIAQTNDLGQYRIYGLPPGDYYVSATLRGGGEMMVVERVAATFVASASASNAGPSASEPRSGYAPTYYPGTPNGAEAQKIALAVGQEMPNADFSLQPVRLSRVSGMVIGSDGRPVEGAMVQPIARNADTAATMIMPLTGSARTDKNGAFSLNNIAPGEYTLQVRGVQTITQESGGDRMMFTMRMVGGGDGSSEFGSTPVSVGGDDVSNVVILTSKGTSVSGRVVFEGGAKPANTATVRIGAPSIDMDGGPLAMPSGSASITPEGTFEIKGLIGNRLIRPTGLPAGWLLKSVTVNGTDITDTGIALKANEPVTGVEVVLTAQATTVSGGVTGSDGQPAKDYTLVVFPQDQDKWTAPMNRYLTGVRPNQDGRYTVRNLPEGSYYAVAVDYIAAGDWQDPEVLARLVSKATKFTLSEGESKTLDLKIASN